jgi:ABC-type multidrug transport system fused ATPase/permease subunit
MSASELPNGVTSATPASGAGAPQPPLSTKLSRINLLIGDRRRTVVALAMGSIVSGFTEAGLLAVIAELATTLVSGAKRAHVHLGGAQVHVSVGTLLIIAFGLAFVRLLLQAPLSILPARIAADVQAGLRERLFDSYTRASWDVQSRDREGQLQETMTGQVMQATGAALQSTALINSMFTFVVLLVSAVALNPLAAVVVGVLSVALFAFLRPLRGRGVRYARALSKAQMGYAGGIAEAIRVAEETQVFGVGAAQRSRISGYVKTSRDLFYRSQVLVKLVGNVYQSLIYILLVGGMTGLYLVGRGHAASLGGVVLVLMRAGMTGQNAQAAYQGLSQSLPFVERTQDAERRYADSAAVDGGQPLTEVRTLAFEDVSFAYNPGRPVLSEVSFEVAGGEVVGIIGPSGAGKSTLVQLLLRLRVAGSGRYVVNGEPAELVANEDWHRLVSYVPQEPRLLHASVAENIRYFREIDDDSVERAARLARIHDDIMGWSDGYDTIVGPRADAVSGGQQQRICLARALAARPAMLVLDEPTSALDPHSEALITESLTALKSELTLFIIAHRMSTLEICDRVMVIVGGRLAAFDTKASLQRDNTYYRHASALAAGTAGN